MRKHYEALRERFYAAWRLCLVETGYAAFPETREGLPWADSQGLWNLLRLDQYTWPERLKVVPPLLLRACVNDYLPAIPPAGFKEPPPWRTADPTIELNTRVEVTFLPTESAAVAGWLPLWLAWRLDPSRRIARPPECLQGLVTWGEPTYVYYWTPGSERVHEQYLAAIGNHGREVVA